MEFASITQGDSQQGFVPGYHFRVFNSDGLDIDHVNFRVGDTQHVRMAAGHVGFEILEKHRGNRYASKACLALAPWIATFNEPVLITTDPENLASIRTIQRIGGVFLDEVDVPEGDPHYLRGSHRKKRYLWEPKRMTSDRRTSAMGGGTE